METKIEVQLKESTTKLALGFNTDSGELEADFGETTIVHDTPGDTGFLSLSTMDVIIGPNEVSRGDEAVICLNGFVNWCLCAASLLDNPDTQNQLVSIPGIGDHSFRLVGYQYCDGVLLARFLSAENACTLKEGSRYRLWFTRANNKNPEPYPPNQSGGPSKPVPH